MRVEDGSSDNIYYMFNIRSPGLTRVGILYCSWSELVSFFLLLFAFNFSLVFVISYIRSELRRREIASKTDGCLKIDTEIDR